MVCPCAPGAFARSVDEIRAAWQSVRGYEPLHFGELIFVASDDYSGEVANRQADPTRANQLTELAYQAADCGEAALAIRLATEAVCADPECEPARLALGYEKHNGHWLTPYGARMAKRGLEWNSQFGWIAPDDLPRYEAGERRYRRRWISADNDAERHATIKDGWQVRTDHFNVTTNHSLTAGVQLAAKLEQLYQVWHQLFADFAIDNGELRARFEHHRVPGVRSRPMQVVYHRSRDQYNQRLRSRQPRIAETIGIYFDHEREAHFFYSPDDTTDATLYHESVHQLFQESDRARRDPGVNDNFWAIEGVACWFESLLPQPSHSYGMCYTIGTPTSGRLPAARHRLLVDGYRVPLADLVALGKPQLQRRTDLGPLYSQMAGQAAFLMFDVGRRGAMVAYLKEIYTGNADPASLANLTGQSYASLDAQYREFLEQLPQ